MYNYDYFKSHTPRSIIPLTEYSVLIPIVSINGEDCLLYQVRAKTLKRQPCEISFPGGKREGNESSKTAAIRETCEELGISSNQIKIYGEMDYIVNHDAMINVFVGRLNIASISTLNVNRDEVDSIFTVPIKHLKSIRASKYTLKLMPEFPRDFPFDKIQKGTDYSWRFPNFDVYFYEANHQIIWGLTAKITHHFLNFI